MTLDTSVYIHGDVDRHEVFAFCQSLLGPVDGQRAKDTDWHSETVRMLMNEGGQGLPAWLMVRYDVAGPLRTDGDACSEDCDEADDYHHHLPAHLIEVSFDTAYGYRDEQGRGCGDLHACYVAALGGWLDGRGIAWSWHNEFTGDIHGGPDRYERLADLTGESKRATEWFRSLVLPAIQAAASTPISHPEG